MAKKKDSLPQSTTVRYRLSHHGPLYCTVVNEGLAGPQGHSGHSDKDKRFCPLPEWNPGRQLHGAVPADGFGASETAVRVP
jgi:hypothetical protein